MGPEGPHPQGHTNSPNPSLCFYPKMQFFLQFLVDLWLFLVGVLLWLSVHVVYCFFHCASLILSFCLLSSCLLIKKHPANASLLVMFLFTCLPKYILALVCF